MPKWPIRVKLIAGLSLVVGMMLTLMGGALFGLNAFHASNLMHTDLLREFGASEQLIEQVARLEVPRDGLPEQQRSLQAASRDARKALSAYLDELRKNATRRNRVGDGKEERNLACGIDYDLGAILDELDPNEKAPAALAYTPTWVRLNPEVTRPASIEHRIDRIFHRVMRIPHKLYQDVYSITLNSRRQYEAGQITVWLAALAVVAVLVALAVLFNRWVLYPIRLLQRGSGGWPGGRSTTRSSSTPATRCRPWPRPSTT